MDVLQDWKSQFDPSSGTVFHRGDEGTPAAPVKIEQEVEQEIELLPLDAAERVVCFQRAGSVCRHIFRRLTPADWDAFFANVAAEFAGEDRGYSQVIDTDTASLVLYARAILRAEGYRTRDARKPEELPSWPECIPQDHRMAAIDVLMNTWRPEADDSLLLEAEGKSVSLEAVWNEGEPGKMKVYSGLVHRFKVPTAEHRRRFLRAKNKCFVVGGSRRGKTMIPSSHGVLLSLYDDLILSAEGYSVGGRPIAPDQIQREMDAFHKTAAVGQLFPTNVETEQELPKAE